MGVWERDLVGSWREGGDRPVERRLREQGVEFGRAILGQVNLIAVSPTVMLCVLFARGPFA